MLPHETFLEKVSQIMTSTLLFGFRILMGIGFMVFSVAGFKVSGNFKEKRANLGMQQTGQELVDAVFYDSTSSAAWIASLAFVCGGIAVWFLSPLAFGLAFLLLALGGVNFGYGYQRCAETRRSLDVGGEARALEDIGMRNAAYWASVGVLIFGAAVVGIIAVVVQHI